MKNISFPLFVAALVLLLFAKPVRGADYQLIRTGETAWENSNTGTWNQNAPWNGTPGAGGPGAGDRLDLAPEANLNLAINAPAPSDPSYTSITRYLSRLTAGTAGGTALLHSYNYWDSTLEISGNIELSGGASLQLYNRNSSSKLRVNVGGNIQVASGSTLYLGFANPSGTGQSVNDSLQEYTVAGRTIINGTLINSGSNNTTNSVSTQSTLGDLEVNGTVIGSQGGDGTGNFGNRTYNLNARSLSGSGTIYGSSIPNTYIRDIYLNLTTVATSDKNFTGTLLDSSVVAAGANQLHLTLSGSGRQTLSGNNTYSGQTKISSGTLLVNGTHIQSSNGVGGNSTTNGLYRVEDGGVLGGNGRIAGMSNQNNTNMVYVTDGGVLVPGDDFGTLILDGGNITGTSARVLRLDSGAALSFTLAGDGSDASELQFWNYGGAGDIVLNNNKVHLTLSGAIVEGTYTVALVTFFSDDGTTAATSGIGSGLTLTGASLDPLITNASLIFHSTNISLQYTVIPEPSSGWLLLMGLALGVALYGKGTKGHA